MQIFSFHYKKKKESNEEIKVEQEEIHLQQVQENSVIQDNQVFVRFDSSNGQVFKNYKKQDKGELSATAGEYVLITSFSGGWFTCVNQKDEKGLLPDTHVRRL